jgi:hypothetical protein
MNGVVPLMTWPELDDLVHTASQARSSSLDWVGVSQATYAAHQAHTRSCTVPWLTCRAENYGMPPSVDAWASDSQILVK